MRTLNDYFLHAEIADISTASSTFVPVPDSGKIIKIITALQGAISGANAGITAKVNTTNMTGGTITIAHSGSAAGDIDTCEPTGANSVVEGDYIAIATDGASTGTHSAHFTIIVRR